MKVYILYKTVLISNVHISDLYTHNYLYWLLCFCYFVHCLFEYCSFIICDLLHCGVSVTITSSSYV